ncbi:hypothetical protein V1478_017727, partial [Vespula squamosa]
VKRMDCSRAWGKGPGGVSGGVAERRVPDLPALPVAMMVVVGSGVGGGGCLAPKRDLSDVGSSLVKGKKGLESKGEPQNTRVQQTQERFTVPQGEIRRARLLLLIFLINFYAGPLILRISGISHDPLKDGPFRRRGTEVCILTWKIGNER